MNKLVTFFCVVFFLIETSDSFAQQIKSIIVSKDNKIDQRDYLQNQENCIYLCSINELNSFKETLESNIKSDQSIFLIQLNDISTFSIHNTDLVNAIVFKLPYELSSSIIQRWLPVGWSINKVENSTDFIYAVQRSANGQCSKEEKILLFQEMFLKSLDLIEKSKNSYEYTLYSNQQLSKENSKNYTLIVSLTRRIDSLQNAFIKFNESEKSIAKNQNSFSLEWNSSLIDFNKNIGDFNLQKLNFNALSLTWKYSINSNFKMGIGYQYGETNFRTFTSYDSTSVSAQTNLGLNFTKSTIIRNLTENNSHSFNSILLNFGYIKNIRKHITFDLSSTINYCPKLLLKTSVIDGFADYKGHFNGISETLTNISELGLESNVSLFNKEFQTTNSLIQFSFSPGIQYENERFFSRIGVGYSLLFFNQISNMQTNRSNKIGEFNSSLSTFGNFSAQTVTFSLSAGIKL
jgi:hypothetical protein